MEIFIRRISIEDAASINMLSTQLGYPISLQETISNMNQVMGSTDNCAFVAIMEGKIIGWIHAFKSIRIETKPFIEIGGLVVDENYREKGIGKALVYTVIEWSKSQKNTSLRVRCNTKRLETHKFYSKLGFRETKEQKIFQVEIVLP
ncbi:MAG TPA: GNAT family N-acetyltransferase [Bacteroidia bacterium]|jgi:predicted N-acetyltransferase YhbS|nr:GNAT family N-acetyltransferase [Bacteroidia bacterium]